MSNVVIITIKKLKVKVPYIHTRHEQHTHVAFVITVAVSANMRHGQQRRATLLLRMISASVIAIFYLEIRLFVYSCYRGSFGNCIYGVIKSMLYFF